jgi:nitrogen fixation protein
MRHQSHSEKKKGQPIRWEDLNEEQLLELEDELLANGALVNLENLWEEGLEEIPEVPCI